MIQIYLFIFFEKKKVSNKNKHIKLSRKFQSQQTLKTNIIKLNQLFFILKSIKVCMRKAAKEEFQT